MTDDAKRLVEALRVHAEWAHANEWESPITLGDDLEEAADMIEKLSEELESDERQYGRDAFAVLADEGAKLETDRDAWKRRAEAAERDIRMLLIDGDSCQYCGIFGADGCSSSLRCENAASWRGPCAENGVQHENTRGL